MGLFQWATLGLFVALALTWAHMRGVERKLEAAEARLAVARWERDQAQEAARVAEAYHQREAARADRLDASIEALLTGDFANADTELDPRIVRLLRCLRDPAAPGCDSGGAGGAEGRGARP